MVLVVDDEPHIARLVAEALKDEGIRAEVVTDGRSVVAAAERLRPNLVLLDVVMPFISLDEQLTQLRGSALTRTVPIMLVTADARMVRQTSTWQQYGVADCVLKPFDLDDLLARVKQGLTRNPSNGLA